jgi:hypothetical protein
MEGYFSAGQSPQWAVLPVEEKEEEKEPHCGVIQSRDVRAFVVSIRT